MNFQNLGIIQARIGSKRLKNKMMLRLDGQRILDWVITRCKLSKSIDKLVIATSTETNDDLICHIANENEIEFFRGSENDVLERFYLTSKKYEPSNITRICADNPFIDPIELDKLYKFFISNTLDYSCNHQQKFENKYPDGFGAEIFTSEALNKMNEKAFLSHHREHVTSYIYDNLNKFKISTPIASEKIQFPKLKFDIDTSHDYNYLKKLVEKGVSINSSACEIVSIAKKLINY
jgi:spore coat polysaccharide biosynthesis protein SpsF